MGGIGKTALAVEAAHRACATGWFPGGTLFVDLRGYDDDPVTADQAVLALLDAMGVRGVDLPSTAARQYDAYRALLAERQAQMLLILDNASDPSQFLDLLPGTDHHRVLITSRDRPDTLPVRLINLATLVPDESVALIARALHDADEHDDRPEHEPDAVSELASLCDHLPLALQIAAAMLRRRRHRDIASLVAEIKKLGDTLVVLDNGSKGTDQYGRSLALRPVLETSYRRLPPDQARLLRLLALAPGAETGTEAVAALADLDMAAAMDLLENLAAACLVTGVRMRGDVQWRLHDLVRAFGAGVVAGDAELRKEGQAARKRLLGFYLRWTAAANDRLRWLPGRPEPERFADRAQALTWLDGERAGLVAAAQWAAEERYTPKAAQLAACLAEYLRWRRHVDEGITVARAAREGTHRIGDRMGEAEAWTNLGRAQREAGQAEEAIDSHTHARDLYQAAGNHRLEAMAWNNLGVALQAAGRLEEAIPAYNRARGLCQAAGDHLREAMALGNLGNALLFEGRGEEAVHTHIRVRDLFQAAGDRFREGMAWHNLGIILQQTGQVAEAIKAYDAARELRRQFGDWYGAGQTLHNLALVHEAIQRPAEARAYYLQAAEAFTRANAPTEAAEAQSAAQTLT
ncbi:regulator [Streptomyces curacoi]|uniref:Regulator n=2 Tax=Streptomyces curacoi TaxID=146536 RepID=A0A124GXH8_9ACTN|nr:regulator [Streptomyces curacoi]